jgi:hypothetical protein
VSRFIYTAPDGSRLVAERDETGAVHIETSTYGCAVELAHLEEVVAGLRDMARQAGRPASGPTHADAVAMLNRMATAAGASPCMCGHRKAEHIIVSGRLLCDSCDPDDTTAPTCTGYDAAVAAEGAGA